MVTIHAPNSPVASCRHCGVQRQFHTASDIPHSADRDHEFAAVMLADFEPGDLSPEQLVAEIYRCPNEPRAIACGTELRALIAKDLGVSWDELTEVLA